MYILNENIRRLRKSRGWTQRELAERLDISDKTVSRWESGIQLPDAQIIPELAEMFGVSIGELYGEEQERGFALPAAEDAAGSEEIRPCFPAPKRSAVRRVWAAVCIGVFFTLLGSLGLVLNNIWSAATGQTDYRIFPGTSEGRTLGLISLSVGIGILIVSSTVFHIRCMRTPRMNYTYTDTELNLRLVCAVLYSLVFLFVLPRFLGFAVNTAHITFLYSAAFVINLISELDKRALKEHHVKTKTVFSVLSWVIGGLSLIVIIVCTGLRAIEPVEISTAVSADPEIVGVTQQVFMGMAVDHWLSEDYFYFLLAASVPLTAMLLLNLIPLKLQAHRLRRESGEVYGEEKKPRAAGVVVASVIAVILAAGAVFGMLKASRALPDYVTVTVTTDSMRPTLNNGESVSICTSVDTKQIDRDCVVLYEQKDGLQMLGRVARVNYDDAWDATSYVVVQDDPENTYRELVYPESVVGVWLDAPESAYENEYE